MYFQIPIKQMIRIAFALSFAATAFGLHASPSAQAQEEGQIIRQFDRLTINSGWILFDTQLFWTSDAGQSWDEISPAVPSDARIQDVEFTNANTGWALWSTGDASGSASFHMAHTTDSGGTWTTYSLSLFEPGEIASFVEKAEMGWFDSQTGWISVKQVSGSNFSLGALFTTSDGGTNWSRSVLPVADQIYFSNPQTGWAVGGPAGDEIFHTQDGGVTWKDVRTADIPDDIQAAIYPPFISGGQGLLVITTSGAENNLNIYSLENSDQWSFRDQVNLDASPDRIALSILDAQNFVATIPGTGSIVRMTNGEVGVLDNQDGLSASIVELDMVSLDVGWARSVESNCTGGSSADPRTDPVSCFSSTRLLQTADGGVTWQSMDLPIVQPDVVSSRTMDTGPAAPANDLPLVQNTEVLIGQGFDKCEIPSLSQMQTWSDASPYQAVNLYIGGSSRACDNTALTSAYLSELYRQGWKFIPTWVGPQAPCTGYHSRMSYDVTVAFGQGVNEANLAVERLAALDLTDPDKTGSVVYYDIEHYGTNTMCRAAVNAFMNGWVSQIHARGNLAGVYGSTLCDTGLSDFRNITHVPDVIWPARWYHNLGQGYYDPNASVWNLGSCIPNTAWSNHQRIRQYEGDHTELWGGLALGIDSNVLDGVVAIPDTIPVEVKFAKNTQGPYKFVPHQIRLQSYANINKGPVQIISPTNVPVIGSERVIHKVNGVEVSFSEMMALPDSQLDTTYWLPWYNNKDLNTQLRFANVSDSEATVHVTIGGVEMAGSPYTLAPGASTRRSYAGIDKGPVEIESNVPIVAAERVVYNVNGVGTSFTEMMALPDSQLDTVYWLPWYNNKELDTQLRFANVSDTEATVHVFIGSVEMTGSPYTLAPGASTRKSYAGIDKGPVQIESNVPIVAAERVVYKVNGVGTSFTEMMALPDSQLDNIYWLPWYDNQDMNTQLRFANVSNSTATVRVYIGGVEMTGSPFTLGPRASSRKSFAGVEDGPVKIESNVKIIAAERVVYNINEVGTSFTEMMGLPDSLLDNMYWLPWYNNVELDTQLRFGVP